MKAYDLRGMGERKTVDMIARILTGANIPVGIGDDCAAIHIGKDLLLVTTDMINERTHTPKATPRQMGWHLVAINLSDIGAKGGRPIGLVTALGLPSGTRLDFVRELAKGIDACARTFDTHIIGGDTKESSEINLTATAFGLVGKRDFMARRGARPGDAVALTGDLGDAAAGLVAIKSGLKRPKAISSLLEPWPRVKEGMALGRTRVVTSCIDTSDGLSSSLHHLARASGVGFKVERDRLPISPEVAASGLDWKDACLHFGGEYELLMTVRPKDIHIARKTVAGLGTRFTVIGEVTKKDIYLEDDGKRSRIENLGWEHFKPVKRPRRASKGKRSPSKRKRMGT